MDNDITSMRERLTALSYNDVRKEAKRYGVSGSGKKVEIIQKILEANTPAFSVIEETEANAPVESNNVEYDYEAEDNMNTAVEPPKKDLDSDMSTAIESPLKNMKSEMETAGGSSNKDVTMETNLSSSHTALNETFTISIHSEEREFLSDDEDHAHNIENFNPKTNVNVSMLSEDAPIPSFFTELSAEKSNVTAPILSPAITLPSEKSGAAVSFLFTQTSDWDIMDTQSIGEDSIGIQHPITSTPTSASRKILPRFSRQHAALFEKMESIADVDSRRKQRIGKRDGGMSSRLKQLAMPKWATESKDAAVFSTPTNPKELSFKFGDVPVEDIAKVQRTPIGSDTAPLKRRPSLRLSVDDSADKKVNVKQLTKSASKLMSRAGASRRVIHATTPVMTTRLERLATPRGRVKPPLDDDDRLNGTSKYTPHKGRYQYIDTTKMTDFELADYLAAKANK